ncbi:MAG TPA: hypothetical protein VIC26_01950 [Marinagarivorans sp.]
MAKLKFRISKKTRFLSHMLACVCFIGLFIWGWDLPVSDVVAYLLVSLGLLLVLISIAAVLGLALRLFRRRSPWEEE